MKMLLALAAGSEVVTGLALVLEPSLFTRLVFAGDLSAPGRGLAPLAGFALFALAAACWPSRDVAASPVPALRAMFLFSFLCAVYLLYRGFGGAGVGLLLWPAAVFHGVLALLLARAWLSARKPATSGR